MMPWRDALKLTRPRQWIKTAFVFAPLCFAFKFTSPAAWGITLLAALAFLSAACAIYIFNDWNDRKEDALHPIKRYRPLASGHVQGREAWLLAVGLLCLCVLTLLGLPAACSGIILIYLLLNLVYTLKLKHIAVLDVILVSICYVLRVLMGATAIQVVVSPWIILTTFFLALFLACGKRAHELGVEGYAEAKANLRGYNMALLDKMVTITAAGALMTYAIYTAEVAKLHGQVGLTYTTGFVAFGLFRYLQRTQVAGQGGEPERVVLKDKLQLVNLLLWLVVTLSLLA